MSVKAYVVDSDKRIERVEKLTDNFLKWVDTLIYDGLAKDLGPNGNITRATVDKAFKLEKWEKYKSSIGRGKRSMMVDLKKIYKVDLEELMDLYPGSETTISNVGAELTRLSNALDSHIESVIGQRGYLKKEVTALRYAFTASQYSNEIGKIKSYLKTQLKSSANISTELITATNNIFQDIRSNFFKGVDIEGVKRYEYVGVYDSKTRGFCREHIGKVRTENQWKSIHNNQNGDAWHNRGGYNCRHMLLLIDEKENENEEK